MDKPKPKQSTDIGFCNGSKNWKKLDFQKNKGIGRNKLDKYKVEIETLLKNGSTKKLIAKHHKTSESNSFNFLKKQLNKLDPDQSILLVKPKHF